MYCMEHLFLLAYIDSLPLGLWWNAYLPPDTPQPYFTSQIIFGVHSPPRFLSQWLNSGQGLIRGCSLAHFSLLISSWTPNSNVTEILWESGLQQPNAPSILAQCSFPMFTGWFRTIFGHFELSFAYFNDIILAI